MFNVSLRLIEVEATKQSNKHSLALVNFKRRHISGSAAGDSGFEYFDEADNLANNSHLHGGHTAIIMYSKMQMVRVVVHESDNLDAMPTPCIMQFLRRLGLSTLPTGA